MIYLYFLITLSYCKLFVRISLTNHIYVQPTLKNFIKTIIAHKETCRQLYWIVWQFVNGCPFKSLYNWSARSITFAVGNSSVLESLNVVFPSDTTFSPNRAAVLGTSENLSPLFSSQNFLQKNDISINEYHLHAMTATSRLGGQSCLNIQNSRGSPPIIVKKPTILFMSRTPNVFLRHIKELIAL